MGILLSLPKLRGIVPLQFSAHICCGQMAEWINMSLGVELRLVQATFCVRWGPRTRANLRLCGAHFLQSSQILQFAPNLLEDIY